MRRNRSHLPYQPQPISPTRFGLSSASASAPAEESASPAALDCRNSLRFMSVSPLDVISRQVQAHGRSGGLPLAGPVATNQSVGRRIVCELRLLLGLQLRHDALGQYLAQFHAPLVERVDVPDRPLREDAVFVQ